MTSPVNSWLRAQARRNSFLPRVDTDPSVAVQAADSTSNPAPVPPPASGTAQVNQMIRAKVAGKVGRKLTGGNR